MTTYSMRISGEGLTRWGLNSVRGHEAMYDAHAAISGLHDALLAVAKGDITPEQVREFFWKNDLAEAKYLGDVLSFEPEKCCPWPKCDCPVSFPEGTRVTLATMCPRAGAIP